MSFPYKLIPATLDIDFIFDLVCVCAAISIHMTMKSEDLLSIELDVRRDLARLSTDTVNRSEAHQIQNRIRSALGRLAQMAETSAIPMSSTEAQRLQDQYRYQAAQLLQQLKIDLRKANISFERNRLKFSEKERDELMNRVTRSTRDAERTDFSDDAALQQAQNVTAALERTRQLLQDQIQFSQDVHEMMDEGTELIRRTEDTLGAIRSSSDLTREAQARIRRREKTDRLLIAIGFLFYLLVIVYIFNKRVGLRIWYIIDSLTGLVTSILSNDNNVSRDL